MGRETASLVNKIFKEENRVLSGPNRKSQILFLIDAAVINAAYVLTSGVFLSGYIISLNGSDVLVALLNNSAVWAAIISLVSFVILERLRKRKALLMISMALSRSLLFAIIFVPLIIKDTSLLLTTVSIMVIVANVLWGFYQLGWMIWYMEIAPEDKKNAFVYFRMFIVRIAFTITTLVMGFVLDCFDKSYKGFVVVYSVSFALSVIDLVILKFTKEPEYKVKEKSAKLSKIFLEPFGNHEFKKYLIFVFTFYLFLTISNSFTSIYFLRYLNFDYGFISTINVLSYIIMILSTKFWARLQHQSGNIFVLKFSAIFVVLDYLIYFLLTEKTYFLMIFTCLIGGLGNGGFNIAIMARRYEIMPQGSRSVYEGWFKAIYGTSVLFAPMFGEMLMKILPEFTLGFITISRFQMLYLFSFVMAGIVVIVSFFKPALLGRKNGKTN